MDDRVLYYNGDLLVQAGLTDADGEPLPPDTWEQMLTKRVDVRSSVWLTRARLPCAAPTAARRSSHQGAQAYIMTPNGSPERATCFCVYKLFDECFSFFRLGYGAAMASVLFVIVIVLTLINMAASKKWVHYAGESGRRDGATQEHGDEGEERPGTEPSRFASG